MILSFLITRDDYIAVISFLSSSNINLRRENIRYLFSRIFICFLALIIAYLTENILFGYFSLVLLLIILINFFIYSNKILYKKNADYVTCNYSYIFDTEVKIELNDNYIIKEDIDGIIKRKISSINEITELKNQFLIKTRDIYIIIPKSNDTNFGVFKDLILKIVKKYNISYKNGSV